MINAITRISHLPMSVFLVLAVGGASPMGKASPAGDPVAEYNCMKCREVSGIFQPVNHNFATQLVCTPADEELRAPPPADFEPLSPLGSETPEGPSTESSSSPTESGVELTPAVAAPPPSANRRGDDYPDWCADCVAYNSCHPDTQSGNCIYPKDAAWHWACGRTEEVVEALDRALENGSAPALARLMRDMPKYVRVGVTEGTHDLVRIVDCQGRLLVQESVPAALMAEARQIALAQ